jgi:hypothetical protein
MFFFACILVSTAINSNKIVSYMIEPAYSFSDMCKSVQEHMKGGRGDGRCLLLGNFANTISMATGIPSIDEMDTTITLDERVARLMLRTTHRLESFGQGSRPRF